jgi:parallel beta-helix repeat protein
MENHSTNRGGGIFCNTGSEPTLSHCLIAKNQLSSDLYWSYGCGIYIKSSSPLIIDCFIEENYGAGGYSYQGGGVFCSKASPVISNCIIRANEIGYATYADGGGLFISDSEPVIKNCTIQDNLAWDSGGGIYTYSSRSIIDKCVIISNECGIDGGGIYCCGAALEISNCTISRNDETGIYSSDSDPTFTNCILWNNLGDEIYSYFSRIIINYSDIQGGWEGIENIDLDPKFTDPESYDYRLLADSPCIDAGDPTYEVPYGGGCRIDMGAFEYYKGFNCKEILRTKLKKSHPH